MQLKKFIALLGLMSLIAFAAVSLSAQKQAAGATLPLDPSVVMKRLPNGMTYFIKKNARPENRVELRLAINSGSNLEDDDQHGLAHFVEHMCFNGTKNFPEQELIKYLEGIGMNFGADLNAYTSFDETVYMLQLPVENKDDINTGFRILADWASNVTFAGEEIDKERGVIIEEWRQRYNNVNGRYSDFFFPQAFAGSIYAKRMPIGTVPLLESFPHERLIQYYKDWYTPDRMAIIVVGDIEIAEMEAMILETLGKIPANKTPKKKDLQYFPTPHKEPRTLVFRDKEQPTSSIGMIWKGEENQDGTRAYYDKSLRRYLASQMFGARVSEIVRSSAEPPFRGVSVRWGSYFRYMSAGNFNLAIKDETKPLDEYRAALREVRRVLQHGFLQSEVDRKKAEFMSQIEQELKEAGNRKSGDLAMGLVRHFLTSSPFLDPAFENKLDLDMINSMTVESMNKAFRDMFMQEDNLVIVVQQPDKPEVPKPTEAEIMAIFKEVMAENTEPYTENVSDAPLVSKMPTPGTIVNESHLPNLNTFVWKLSNGSTVVLKPTEFKNDEILMSLSIPGGYSVAGTANLEKNFISYANSDALQNPMLSGLGQFSAVDLQKKLSGKQVNGSFFVDECAHGARGNSTVDDFETLLQLVYVGMTEPRLDPVAISSLKAQYTPVLKNRSSQPNAVFQDSVAYITAGYHYSAKPFTLELLNEWDHEKIGFPFFNRLFSDASGMTVVLVGSFDPEQIKPHILQYIASLPSSGAAKACQDMGVTRPEKTIKKDVFAGESETSNVMMQFYNSSYKWSRQENSTISITLDILENKLREALREEMGGTYGVGIYPRINKMPKPEAIMNISFGTAPDKVDALVARALEILEEAKKAPADAKLLADAKMKALKGQETRMQENGFWLSQLSYVYQNDEDPNLIVTYKERIDAVTAADVQRAIQQYFDPNRYAQFVLYPAASAGK